MTTSQGDPDEHATRDPPADSGLRCPQCLYNLTGLTSNRCPECGSELDPERLHRMIAGEPPPAPISLKIVAWLFILGGALALVDVIVSAADKTININFGVLGLLIGPGLLRLSRGWRTCALVFIWLGLILIPIATALVLAAPGLLDVRVLGQTVGHVPKSLGLASGVIAFLLVVWQYRVLTRRDVRELFRLTSD